MGRNLCVAWDGSGCQVGRGTPLIAWFSPSLPMLLYFSHSPPRPSPCPPLPPLPPSPPSTHPLHTISWGPDCTVAPRPPPPLAHCLSPSAVATSSPPAAAGPLGVVASGVAVDNGISVAMWTSGVATPASAAPNAFTRAVWPVVGSERRKSTALV